MLDGGLVLFALGVADAPVQVRDAVVAGESAPAKRSYGVEKRAVLALLD